MKVISRIFRGDTCKELVVAKGLTDQQASDVAATLNDSTPDVLYLDVDDGYVGDLQDLLDVTVTVEGGCVQEVLVIDRATDKEVPFELEIIDNDGLAGGNPEVEEDDETP